MPFNENYQDSTIMKSNYKHLLVWALALMSMVAVAEPIDSVAARQVAQGFLASDKGAALRCSRSGLRLTHAEPSAVKSGSTDYYVFSTDGNTGFIIIAGDDRAKQPLAYGETAFDTNDVPCNLQWLLQQYAEQMEYLFAHPDAHTTSTVPTRTQTVPEMLTTRWGQQKPYYNQCPEIDGKSCATGCVATTMAQVMNYWKFPAILPSLPAYTTQTQQLEVPALLAIPVAWELLKDTYYDGNYTQAQGAEVAKLMRYCGQASNMDYRPTSSGTSTSKQLKAFQAFYYDKSASLLNREDYTDEQWNALIQEDLYAGYPVVYAGQDATTSHNFIIDGFDGAMYHINWGWTGSFNGYFELDAMSAGSFKPANHSMLHGIHPLEQDVTCDFVQDDIFYKIIRNDEVEVTFMTQNYNSYSGNVTIPETVDYLGHTYVVKAIGDNAFAKSKDLKSVTIPKTVTSIGKRAFYYSGITAITIPDEVLSMGPSAFSRCSDLTSVTLSNQLKEISDDAFSDCKELADITLHASIAKIGNNAFRNTNLYSIDMPDSISSIGKLAFDSCPSLTSVTLGSGLISLGDSAFSNCPQMIKLTIESAALSMGNYAFVNSPIDFISCKSLTPPAGSPNCFSNTVYQNALLRVPAVAEDAYRQTQPWQYFIQIVTCDENDFIYCDDYIYLKTSDSTVEINGYTGHDENLIIPSTIVDGGITYTINAIGNHAFWLNDELQSVEIPNTVTSIGKSAFQDCENLCNIKLSTSLESIGSSAFKKSVMLTSCEIPECVRIIGDAAFAESSITNIVIPNSVTCVGQSAFQSCISLLNVTLGSSLKEINDSVFKNCKSLQAIEIPTAITTIGYSAFENCSSLTDVSLNTSLKSIATKAFKKCSRLSSIELPEGLETIGAETFKETALNQLVIPNSVTHINVSAFNSCSSLTNVTLGSSLSSLGELAFSYCKNLTELTIKSSSLTMGEKAFNDTGLKKISCDTPKPPTGPQNCFLSFNKRIYKNAVVTVPAFAEADYKATSPWQYFSQIITTNVGSFFVDDLILYQTSDSTASVIKSNGINENVTIPEIVIDNGIAYTVNAIMANAFKNNKVLKSVVIPNTVITIGTSAFEGCSTLNSVIMGTAVESIGTSGFKGCSALGTIALPKSLQTIGEQAFMNTGLTSITLPDAVTSIGNSTFEDCSSLASVAFGASMTRIGSRAFKTCNALESIEIPDRVTTIGDEAFMSTSISSIVIPNSVTSMGRSTFYDCKSLSSVTLGPSLSGIGANAFGLCESLKSIDIPNNIVSIGDEAFRSSGLTSIEIPNSVTTMGMGVLADNAALKHVKLGHGLKMIPSHAFASCRNLTKVELGDQVETIGGTAFYYCTSLDSISIPKTVSTIGAHAFYYCQKLTHVFISDLTSWCSIYFANYTAVPFQTQSHLYFDGQEVINCVLPEGVTRLNNYAFYNCAYIQSLKLPSTVSWIDREAFGRCTSLSRVICKAQNPPTTVNQTCFSYDTYNSALLIVPEASMAKYGTSGCWSHFSTLESLESYLRNGDVNFDHETTVADINMIVNAIITGQTDSDLDVNGDREVTVSDINAIIEMILHPHNR